MGDKECWVCKTTYGLERHHIFFGSNRINSERFDLCVYLCHEHHRGTYGVHGMNGHELDLDLKRYGQQYFEINHSREEFMRIFGKNYLDYGCGLEQIR